MSDNDLASLGLASGGTVAAVPASDAPFDTGGVSGLGSPEQGIDNDGMDLSAAEIGMPILGVQKVKVKLKAAAIQYDDNDHKPSRLNVQLTLQADAKSIDGDTVNAGRVVFDGLALRVFGAMTPKQVVDALGQFQVAFTGAKKAAGSSSDPKVWAALEGKEAIASFSTRNDKKTGEVRQQIRYHAVPVTATATPTIPSSLPAGVA